MCFYDHTMEVNGNQNFLTTFFKIEKKTFVQVWNNMMASKREFVIFK